jgi:hypothetical protein
MKYSDAKKEMRELKKEMKLLGIKVKSCFNGGLTPDEYRYNTRLFQLDCEIEKSN